MRAQIALPAEAILGSIRTAGFTCVALLLVTANLPLTLIAFVAVLLATLCLLSLLVLSGWALGSTEAVLANVTPALLTPPAALVLRAYVKAKPEGRVLRAAHAVQYACAPISSGWVAIAAAISPMLACQLATEFKVAAILCFVAVCVSVWIGVFLPLLLACIGPEAPKDGLPLVGSMPWVLMHCTLKRAQRVPINGHAPCTLNWQLARRRNHKQKILAAAEEDRAAAREAARREMVRLEREREAEEAWNRDAERRRLAHVYRFGGANPMGAPPINIKPSPSEGPPACGSQRRTNPMGAPPINTNPSGSQRPLASSSQRRIDF